MSFTWKGIPLILVFGLVAVLALGGCADDGNDGKNGKDGVDGADGADGAVGATGPEGSAGKDAGTLTTRPLSSMVAVYMQPGVSFGGGFFGNAESHGL